jgi:hypothetical protein
MLLKELLPDRQLRAAPSPRRPAEEDHWFAAESVKRHGPSLEIRQCKLRRGTIDVGHAVSLP